MPGESDGGRWDHLVSCPRCHEVLCYRCLVYEERVGQYSDGAGDPAWYRRVLRLYLAHLRRDHEGSPERAADLEACLQSLAEARP